MARALVAVAVGLIVSLACAPLAAAQPTAAGLWQQADSNGHVGGWFLVFKHGDTYEGALVKMFLKPGENPNPICTKCEGADKDKPSLGLIMIKGMQRNGLDYKNGTILDPRSGSVYHALMKLSADGQELTLRGYLGIPLLGKSQVWLRMPDDLLPRKDIPPNLLPYLPEAVPK